MFLLFYNKTILAPSLTYIIYFYKTGMVMYQPMVALIWLEGKCHIDDLAVHWNRGFAYGQNYSKPEYINVRKYQCPIRNLSIYKSYSILLQIFDTEPSFLKW